MNKDTIIAYVRTGHKKMKGVVIATKNPADENEILITGSVCHRNDEFDLQKGIGIARTRAKSMSAGRDVKVPRSLKHPMEYLSGRAQKYFKQSNMFTRSAIIPKIIDHGDSIEVIAGGPKKSLRIGKCTTDINIEH